MEELLHGWHYREFVARSRPVPGRPPTWEFLLGAALKGAVAKLFRLDKGPALDAQGLRAPPLGFARSITLGI